MLRAARHLGSNIMIFLSITFSISNCNGKQVDLPASGAALRMIWGEFWWWTITLALRSLWKAVTRMRHYDVIMYILYINPASNEAWTSIKTYCINFGKTLVLVNSNKHPPDIFTLINQAILSFYIQDRFLDLWRGHHMFAVDGSKINLSR